MQKNPLLTVDGIALIEGNIILIKRKNPPFQGHYALPGGFVEYGETVEAAVIREFFEETGLQTRIKQLVGVYSEPGRDPRGHTVSAVFELEIIGGELQGGDDASEASTFKLGRLPKLAFDHSVIIADYLRHKQIK